MSSYESPVFPEYPDDLRNTAGESGCDAWLEHTLADKIHTLLTALQNKVAHLADGSAYQQGYYLCKELEAVRDAMVNGNLMMDRIEVPTTGCTIAQQTLLTELRTDVMDMCAYIFLFTRECVRAWKDNWNSRGQNLQEIASDMIQARSSCEESIQSIAQRIDVANPRMAQQLKTEEDVAKDFAEQLKAYQDLYVLLKKYVAAFEWFDGYLAGLQ